MSKWNQKMAAQYATVGGVRRHGKDGASMDNLIQNVIKEWEGLVCADVGCGSGRYLLDLILAGVSQVIGSDNSPSMLALARQLIAENGLKGDPRVQIVEDDANYLRHLTPGSVDRILSVNVGCNLESLGPMLQRMYDALKEGGEVFITGPDWLDLIFVTAGTDARAVRQEMNAKLAKGDPQAVASFANVCRATIWQPNVGPLRLFDPELDGEDGLPSGAEIWRKIAGIEENPGPVVPNNWHDPVDYDDAAKAAGFEVNEVSPRALSKEELAAWNAQVPPTDRLGEIYTRFSPFFCFKLTKRRKKK